MLRQPIPAGAPLITPELKNWRSHQRPFVGAIGKPFAWLQVDRDTLLPERGPCHGRRGRHPRQMDPPPVSSWRQAMARDALIAIGIALITVGLYELLGFLGEALVNGP
jgi:hypothetical protein